MESLGDLLARISFNVPTLGATNLRELLNVTGESNFPVNSTDQLRRGQYPGIGAFEVTPRRLVDLYQDLSNAIHGIGDSRSLNHRVLSVFENHWHLIIDEDPFLNGEQKAILRDSGVHACEFVGFPVRDVQDSRIRNHALSENDDAGEYYPTLEVANRCAGNAVPRIRIVSLPEEPEIKCTRTLCGLIFFNDVCVLLRESGNHATASAHRIIWDRLSAISLSWVSESKARWPVPRFETYAEYQRFDNRVTGYWSQSDRDRYTVAPQEIDELVQRYVGLGNHLLARTEPPIQPADWQKLVLETSQLADSPWVPKNVAMAWAQNILLMTMPEVCGIQLATRQGSLSKLPKQVREAANRLKRHLINDKVELERRRGHQLPEIRGKGDTLWNQLNNLSTRNSWVHLVARVIDSKESIGTQINRLEGEVGSFKDQMSVNMDRLETQLKQDNLIKRFESSTRQTGSAFESNPDTAKVFVTELNQLASNIIDLAKEDQQFASTALAQIQQAANRLDQAGAVAEAIHLQKLADGIANTGQLASKHQSTWFELGNANFEAGRTRHAERYFSQWLTFCQTHAKRRPDVEDWQFRLGNAHSWLGDVYLDMEEIAKAEEHYKEYNQILSRLESKKPTDLERARSLGISYSKLGDIYLQTDRLDLAETAFKMDLEIFQRLTEAEPNNKDWLRTLGFIHAYIGDVYLQTDRLELAKESYLEYFDVFKRLTQDDPQNKNWQEQLGVAHGRLGDIYRVTNRNEKAQLFYREDYEIFKRLTEEEPNNNTWLRNRAGASRLMGDLHFRQEEYREAEEFYLDCFNVFSRLAKKDRSNKSWQRSLATSHFNMGNTFLKTARPLEAEIQFRQAIQILERILETGLDNSNRRLNLAVAKWGLSQVVSGPEAQKLQIEAAETFARERKEGNFFFERASIADAELEAALSLSPHLPAKGPSQKKAKKKAAKKKSTKKKSKKKPQ